MKQFQICCTNYPEEVGHGHVTYVCKQIHSVSLWRFLYWKNDQNIFDYPKGNGIIRKRYSGVESEYPVNPVQPLGHFGCRAAWKSRIAEKPVKRLVTAGKQGAYVLRRCLQPSAPCRNVDHRAGFKVPGVHGGTLARLPLVPGHIDMGTRLLR